ncbi:MULTISPECIES: hypothetical protein [unclassified Dermacoccus]|uniref:hypothetical protein n=1 Tax=unclassified Dermacoccus TaxID=2643059 RepID=UPI00101C1F9E|nr:MULTISPECIES: hypothetical protein [unclassified Dermacoccus]MBZ4497819.1 hypothetical protein [Dermacoccus sp. Tok2021]RYI21742.1 hypothetical protein EVU97_10815 [Dermacoccus sp. 147Ba]
MRNERHRREARRPASARRLARAAKPSIGQAIAGVSQALVFYVPVAVVWVFGDHWVPWIVLVTLFAYVVANIVLQAMGTRRITAFVESGGFEERMGAAAKRTTEPSVGNGELG